MLGRPNWLEPVLAKSFAGAWLKTSVATEWTNVRSSTTPARCGRHSETQAPDWPWRANRRDVPSSLGCSLVKMSMNANRRPLMNESGIGWSAVLLKLGLVVEELELAGAAGHEQVDDALGPGGNVPGPDGQRVRRSRDGRARPAESPSPVEAASASAIAAQPHAAPLEEVAPGLCAKPRRSRPVCRLLVPVPWRRASLVTRG